ncbi:hypothetical protein, partial [Streptomyces syringium]|uniref:hypothetical protein n=1 Tax=Streptomyces syringium TaxID=76729 RepID=UPI003442F5C7
MGTAVNGRCPASRGTRAGRPAGEPSAGGAGCHPVHPTRRTVFGLTCHSSIGEVPEQIDLAVL